MSPVQIGRARFIISHCREIKMSINESGTLISGWWMKVQAFCFNIMSLGKDSFATFCKREKNTRVQKQSVGFLRRSYSVRLFENFCIVLIIFVLQ